MSNLPPSPFLSSAACPQAVETAAASPVITSGPVDAAANHFDPDDFNAITLVDLDKRGFDKRAFMEAIEPLPLFLQAPVDVLNVLAGYV